jgi:hypothetical protein
VATFGGESTENRELEINFLEFIGPEQSSNLRFRENSQFSINTEFSTEEKSILLWILDR